MTGGAISSTGIAGLHARRWPRLADGEARPRLPTTCSASSSSRPTERSSNVDDASHPDLIWALRGGGGNFGVAASLVYRLHPVSMVTGGLIAHPIDAAGDMLRFYRDAVAGCSDDLTVFAAVVHAPDGSGMKLAAMVVFHTGDPDQAEADLAPFKSWGSPLMVEVGPMPYPVMNTLLDAAYPDGRAQLLALELHDGPARRAHRRDRRALRVGALADDGDPARALPRRRHARRPDGHGRSAPGRGLEPAASLGVDGSGGHRGEHRVDEGDVRGARPSTSAAAAGSTTSATTRTTRSAPRTARTTTGSSR